MRLIEAGYVHRLFAGNPFAGYDVERALFGTSLGISLDLAFARGGRENLMRAVNAIREAGHKNVFYFRSMQESIEFLLRQARPLDAILTIGAGNVSRASNELMVLLGTEHPTPHAH